MSDPVSLARAARENLARGLAALQSPNVPPQVMVVAEPIANAMSALHRVEASGGAARGEAGPAALNAARHALAMLQQQPQGYPAVDQALEAIAGSLNLIHQLAQAPAPAPHGNAAFAGTVALGAPGQGAPPTQPSPQGWGQPPPPAYPQPHHQQPPAYQQLFAANAALAAYGVVNVNNVVSGMVADTLTGNLVDAAGCLSRTAVAPMGVTTGVHATGHGVTGTIAVTRQRGFHRDVGGFLVTNFSHQNNVGILTQKRPQCRRERQANLSVHLHLV